jgi:hypothetical protein
MNSGSSPSTVQIDTNEKSPWDSSLKNHSSASCAARWMLALPGRAEDRDLAKSVIPAAIDNGEPIEGFPGCAVRGPE